jgi:hypothetical protein
MEIKVVTWNKIDGVNYPLVITLSKDDLERIAMEKARSNFEYNAKITQEVKSITLEL